ncbi:hypothetical protein F5Y01DRAFT_200891 [Xylaria sp. FL0043]|nr:hypothetical protein F5Y01DRAFT_200891 [Xylaria sp. FL0043]
MAATYLLLEVISYFLLLVLSLLPFLILVNPHSSSLGSRTILFQRSSHTRYLSSSSLAFTAPSLRLFIFSN